MSKIMRQTAEIFASQASTAQIAQFGSLAANAPMVYSGLTATPAGIQALANWLQGWFSGVEGAASPAIEDLNGYCFVMAYQIAYCLQTGVAEWDSGTTYFIGSVVNDGHGNLYVSLTDNNLNNALTNTSNWRGNFSVSGSHNSPTTVGGSTAIPILANANAQDVYVIGSSATWTAASASSSKAWVDVCYSTELNLYCAVAANTGTTNIMTSPDGITWTGRTGPTSQPYSSVAWSPYLQLFAAVPGNSGSTTIATSPDGVTWTAQTNPGTAQAWSDIIWVPQLGLFIASSSSITTTSIMTSADGVTWTLRTTISIALVSLAWSPQLNLIVALGGVGFSVYSENGTTWKSFANANASANALVWSDTLSLFVGTLNTSMVYSADGFIWSVFNFPSTAPNMVGIVWVSQLGLFVSVGAAGIGSAGVATSTDGMNWTLSNAISSSDWSGVCYSASQNKFVAVSQNGTNEVMYISPSSISASSQIAVGSVQSQRLSVIGSNDLNSVTLTNGTGLALKQPKYVLKNNTVLNFLWDNTQSLWIQA